MLKKTFVQCLFGTPFPWTEQYFQNFRRLESTGWNLKVFTPNPFPSAGNIEVIPMTLQEYDALVEKHCGVHPRNFLNAKGVPNKLTSDHYPGHGLIFQDYLKDADYWVISNWDCCYGRLSDFLPDEELSNWDIWSDDPSGFNGIFTVMKNDEFANNLFRQVPDWERCFTVHEPCAFDEIRFSETLRRVSALEYPQCIQWGHPDKFPIHSYDRLATHRPNPRLYFDDDGALIEWFDDYVHPPSEKRHFGREIPLFHFSRTKRWPVGPKPA